MLYCRRVWTRIRFALQDGDFHSKKKGLFNTVYFQFRTFFKLNCYYFFQRDKSEIEEKFETLRSSCSVITDLEEQLTETSERCQELMLQNNELENEIEGLREEKNGLETGKEEMEEELGEKRRTCGNQELVSYQIDCRIKS